MISQFWFSVHFSTRAAQKMSALRPTLEGRLVNASVISVIDDDASVRAATDNLLSSYGYIVHTFASAEEFLQSTHLNGTSCVVADVQMPTMSGLDLLSHVRARGYDAPFLFITAFPEESVRARVSKAGGIGFLAKPFAASDLIKCVETALRRRDAGRDG
jgi:FixJ family two-component response regulator